jgi:hypothetical protein
VYIPEPVWVVSLIDRLRGMVAGFVSTGQTAPKQNTNVLIATTMTS